MVENNLMQNPSESNLIYVIGTDASGLDNIPGNLKNLILNVDNIAAPSRLINSVKTWRLNQNDRKPFKEVFSIDDPKKLILWLKKQNKRVVVLTSGDPLWYGIGKNLLAFFPISILKFYPSPTSLQLAFSKIGREWHDASWISLHGRDISPLYEKLQMRPKALAILTDTNQGNVEDVRKVLKASGLENIYTFWLFQKLGHVDERILSISPNEPPLNNLDPLNIVVLIESNVSNIADKSLPLFGIEDGFYLQHHDRPGLMTKKEIRVQILSDLELPDQGVIWDLCAGVGTVGLEALRIRPCLKLLAVEKRASSFQLINKNAELLSVKPEKIYEDDVLNVLQKNFIPEALSTPDRIFLGGGGKKREEILLSALSFLKPGGIVVISLVTLEAISEVKSLLIKESFTVTISQIQSFRGMPLSTGIRLAPQNPVFIVKGIKKSS